MAHGFSAVKEMYLDDYAAAVRRRGPQRAGVRQPQLRRQRRRAPPGDRPRSQQVRDYRHAITYATSLPEVDRSRGRGLGQQLLRRARARPSAPSTAACRAVVSQVPLVSGHENIRVPGPRRLHRRLPRTCSTPTVRPASAARRRAWCPPSTRTRSAPAAMPTPDSYRWFTETHELRAPSWRNEITLRTVEMLSRVRARQLRASDRADPAARARRGERRAHAHRARARRPTRRPASPRSS